MLVSEEENGGAWQLYEVRLLPPPAGPPLHYHVDFIETFTVKQGKLDIYVDKEQKHLPLEPGESATAQIGRLHRFANGHDEPVIFTVETRPAGGVVKASGREARLREDRPGLPAGYTASTSENRFQSRRFNSASHGDGKKVAGLFHVDSTSMKARRSSYLLLGDIASNLDSS
jgi:mannose-6-phosphate isomerase-like protein (cupin superfamily)